MARDIGKNVRRTLHNQSFAMSPDPRNLGQGQQSSRKSTLIQLGDTLIPYPDLAAAQQQDYRFLQSLFNVVF